MILQVESVFKTFGKVKAVHDVSLNAPAGEISGFLGPNGAGKTTMIRMIMDILQPDEGSIKLGKGLSNERKRHIGYLPEERGLYAKTEVRETLFYFARLKGLSPVDAARNVDSFLDRLGMTGTARMKIGKLSKGNQQKIQFIAAVVAKPRLLILDEPFSGLDPVNVNLISQLITELCDEGITILLSTHQMNQAEKFCKNIFLFNQGGLILEGPLEPIIQCYSGSSLTVTTDTPLPESPMYKVDSAEGLRHKITLAEDVTIKNLMEWLAAQPFETHSITPFRVPLSEIFIREVQKHA